MRFGGHFRAGVTWQDTSRFALDAGLFDAPQGIGPFTINTKLDQLSVCNAAST